MKKKIAACLTALLMLGASACGGGGGLLENTNGSANWINSDIKANYDTVGDIRLEDDFHAAINKEWSFEQTEDVGPRIGEIQKLTQENEKELLADDTIQEPEFLELKQYAELAGDWDYRNAQGVAPLQKYVDGIAAIQSKQDVYSWLCNAELNPLGLGVLTITDTGISKELEKTVFAAVEYPNLTLSGTDERAYDAMGQNNLTTKKKVDTYAFYILQRLGYSEKEARRIANKCYQFEKKITEANAYVRLEEKNARYTFDEMVEMAGNYPIEGYWNAMDLVKPNYVVYNKKLVKKADKLCSDVEGFKSMMIMHYALDLAEDLDRETFDFYRNTMYPPDKDEVITEEKKKENDENQLYQGYIGNTSISNIMGKYYTKRYFTPEDQERLEDLTLRTIDTLREDIRTLDWMSDEGKAAAIEKADYMVLHVIEPDYDCIDYSDIQIVSKEEGGSFADAYIQTLRHDTRVKVSLTDHEYDRSKWIPELYGTSTMTLNAFYSPSDNGIYICAGILGGIVYYNGMPEEELLAGIGTIVGHEITHGFDANGMTFNKEGVHEMFTTNEDLGAFNNKAQDAVFYLSTFRPLENEGYYNGNQIVSEMLADMGGFKLCLMMAEKEENFDYDTFFRMFARHWATRNSKDSEKYNFLGDSHPLMYLRTNVCVQQFDKFYETYGIQESDNMYLAPENRIAIW